MVGTATDENFTVVWAVVVAVKDPTVFPAVRVYVVVAVGLTVTLGLVITSPIPLSILRLVAPFTDQVNVLLCPPLIVGGLAVKFVITGVGTTVTVARAMTVALEGPVPVAFVAMSW